MKQNPVNPLRTSRESSEKEILISVELTITNLFLKLVFIVYQHWRIRELLDPLSDLINEMFGRI